MEYILLSSKADTSDLGAKNVRGYLPYSCKLLIYKGLGYK